MGGSYQVEGPATADGLLRLHQLVEQVRSDHPDLAEFDLAMLETAAIELAGNVVEHGRPPDQLHYRFHLDVTADALHAVLVDGGDALPSLPHHLLDDPWAESGRGLAMARTMLTDLTYERRADTNVWLMTRTFSSPEDASVLG